MPALGQKSDVELLLDFSRGQNHAAFEAMVQRHGSMVHGVAKRVLSNHHDAQDVTQATFLVLAREACKLSKVNCLAGWLHTVAHRLSLNALKSRTLRETREKAAMKEESSTNTPSAELQAEFSRELDAAISRLPERYRQPLVMFHLEGASIEEASQRLKLHSGTFRTRLGRARALLRDALEHRGVKISSVGMLAGMLATESKAAALCASSARGISEAVLGKSALGTGAQSLVGVHGLSGSAISTPTIAIMKTKASIIAAAVVAIAALFTSVRLVTQKQVTGQPESKAERLAERRADSPRARHSPSSDSSALSEITSRNDWDHLLASVFLIADEHQRLQAIRQRLGMNISDEVYRRTLEECRYEVDPYKNLSILCQKWTEVDGKAAIQWAQQLPGEMSMVWADGMLSFWLAQDEEAALAWGQAHLEPKRLEGIRRDEELEFFSQLLSTPADQMAEWLAAQYAENSLPSNEWTSNFAETIEIIGYKNPEAAMEFIKTPGFIEEQRNSLAIRQFFSGWAGRDPDAALAAAKKYLEGDLRKDAMFEVLECWQTKYPHRSLEEVVDLNPFSDEQYQSLALSVVAIQARVDLEGAVQRAMQAGNSEMTEKMLDSVMEVRAALAEDEIKDWVTTLPEGEQKDMSLHSLAQALASHDIESGADLVSQISNPNRRDKAVRAVLSQYSSPYSFPESGDLEVGMRLADQLHIIPVEDISRFASVANLDQIAAFKGWLEKRRAEGRIKDDDVLDMNRIINSLEVRKKELE